MTDVYRKADDRMSAFLKWIALRFNQIRKFTSVRSETTAVFDELNVLYRQIEYQSRDIFLTILQEAYDDEISRKQRHFDEDFLYLLLDEPDEYTTVSYKNELERKAEKFAEQIVSAINRSLQNEDRRNENGVVIPIDKEIRSIFDREFNSLGLLLDMYEVRLVDIGRQEAFEDDKVNRVRWVTRIDGKECDYCRSLNGHVFPVKRVPTKPHPRCRCYTIRFD